MTSPGSLIPNRVLHLSLEVSTPSGSMALWDKGSLLWKSEWERSGSHSEIVTLNLAEGLKAIGSVAKDLSFVAVTKGPGSFTGLRVGINIAKTLSQSLKIPIVAPSTLDLLADFALQTSSPSHYVLAALNAFKGMVYWRVYTLEDGNYQSSTEPRAHTWQDVARQTDLKKTYAFVGDGFLPLKNSIPKELLSQLDFCFGEQTRPSALTLGPISYARYQAGDTISWEKLVPLYIRRSEAEEKKREESI